MLRDDIDGRPETWRGRFLSAVVVGGSVGLIALVLGVLHAIPAGYGLEGWSLIVACVALLVGAGCASMTVLIDLGGPVSAPLRRVTILIVAIYALAIGSSILDAAASPWP